MSNPTHLNRRYNDEKGENETDAYALIFEMIEKMQEEKINMPYGTGLDRISADTERAAEALASFMVCLGCRPAVSYREAEHYEGVEDMPEFWEVFPWESH